MPTSRMGLHNLGFPVLWCRNRCPPTLVRVHKVCHSKPKSNPSCISTTQLWHLQHNGATLCTIRDFICVVKWLEMPQNFTLLHGKSSSDGKLQCSNAGFIDLAEFLHSIGVFPEVASLQEMKGRFFWFFRRFTYALDQSHKESFQLLEGMTFTIRLE